MGVPVGGFWKEILNSDATCYGGSGQVALGRRDLAAIVLRTLRSHPFGDAAAAGNRRVPKGPQVPGRAADDDRITDQVENWKPKNGEENLPGEYFLLQLQIEPPDVCDGFVQLTRLGLCPTSSGKLVQLFRQSAWFVPVASAIASFPWVG